MRKVSALLCFCSLWCCGAKTFAADKFQVQVVETSGSITISKLGGSVTASAKIILPNGDHADLFCNAIDGNCAKIDPSAPEKMRPDATTCSTFGDETICTTRDVGNFSATRKGNYLTIEAPNGNLWLFGGGSIIGGMNMNDLWEFNPSSKEWTWISGSNTIGALGVYGTQGVPSSANVPAARMSAVSWIDSSDNLWLFGGNGDFGYMNDLWEFNPSTKEWTWVMGSNTAGASGVYGTLGVAAAGNIPGVRSSAVSWTDSSGNLLLFGGNGGFGDMNDLWEFNPSTKEWTWVKGSNTAGASGVYGTLGVAAPGNVPGARGSAVSWTDSSGNLWLFGGYSNESQADLNDLWEFNAATKEWTWVSGSNTPFAPGVYGTIGVAAAGNVPSARDSAISWTDSSGNLWLFGGYEDDSSVMWGYMNDLWKFNPSNKEWTWVNGSYGSGACGGYGTLGIAASGNVPGARGAAVSWIDRSGDLWLFGGGSQYSMYPPNEHNDLWKYQP